MKTHKTTAVWLLALAIIAFVGCGGRSGDGGQNETDIPVETDTDTDTDSAADTSNTDTGPGDTDTMPFGANCDKPLVLEPGVKHVISGGNAASEWTVAAMVEI